MQEDSTTLISGEIQGKGWDYYNTDCQKSSPGQKEVRLLRKECKPVAAGTKKGEKRDLGAGTNCRYWVGGGQCHC